MPIDLDLIHETITAYAGEKLPWAYVIITPTIIALMAYALNTHDKYHPGRRTNGHPMDKVYILLLFGVLVSMMTAIFSPLGTRIAIGALIIALGAGVFAERKLQKEPLRPIPVEIRRTDNSESYLAKYTYPYVEIPPPTPKQNRDYSLHMQATGVIGAIALAMAMVATFLPHIGVYSADRQVPSDAAITASEEGASALTEGIEAKYSARVIEYKYIDLDNHHDRVQLIDEAADGDPWEAPEVKIATETGIYGEYRVTYDQKTEEVHLLIEQEDEHSAVAPEDLER